MSLSVGIVGLPNVGKSTLFNALLQKQQALAANYPFATIDPNVGVVPVPDSRLEELADTVAYELRGPVAPHPHSTSSIKSAGAKRGSPSRATPNIPPIKPATVKFVDIAGLVKGAASGEGLGNKFLSHIREVSVIAHVVRVFEDEDVIREGAVDVESDYEVIRAELLLSDMQTIENSKLKNQKSKLQFKNKNFLEEVQHDLSTGEGLDVSEYSGEELEFLQGLNLLSLKPEIIVLNVAESEYRAENLDEIIQKYANILSLPESKFVVICAKIESELAELDEDAQKEYLEDLGLAYSGLSRLIQLAYSALGLISFLTAGEKEVRAWTTGIETPAPKAAAVIHTDFEKHFIKADVVSFDDFVEHGGWKNCRDVGRVRSEGRDYIVQEGDVIEFKIGR